MVWKTPPYGDGNCGITHVDKGSLHWLAGKGCKSLLDVGCGTGGQVEAALDLGWSAFGTEVDHRVMMGQRNVALIDCGLNPVIFHEPFDVVWSVEVAEHVPPELESNYLTTLVDNCRLWLVFTANQVPMPLHVNCKPTEYWIEAIQDLGLAYAPLQMKELLKHSTMVREFLRDTGMLFVRK